MFDAFNCPSKVIANPSPSPPPLPKKSNLRQEMSLLDIPPKKNRKNNFFSTFLVHHSIIITILIMEKEDKGFCYIHSLPDSRKTDLKATSVYQSFSLPWVIIAYMAKKFVSFKWLKLCKYFLLNGRIIVNVTEKKGAKRRVTSFGYQYYLPHFEPLLLTMECENLVSFKIKKLENPRFRHFGPQILSPWLQQFE